MMGLIVDMSVWGVLLMLLVCAGLIALTVIAGRFMFKAASGNKPGVIRQHLNAHQVLDQRYLRGEITREEYERIRNDLERSNQTSPNPD
jgi:uncharacterized membrane protein